MARKVEVTLSGPQEAALMDRLGRKCNPEGLVQRAVQEVVRLEAEDIPVFASKPKEAQVRIADPPDPPAEVGRLLTMFGEGQELRDKDGRVADCLYLYPYCQTCKVRCAVSHSDGDQAGIEAFLAAHPSPEHVVDPMWEDEIAKSGL